MISVTALDSCQIWASWLVLNHLGQHGFILHFHNAPWLLTKSEVQLEYSVSTFYAPGNRKFSTVSALYHIYPFSVTPAPLSRSNCSKAGDWEAFGLPRIETSGDLALYESAATKQKTSFVPKRITGFLQSTLDEVFAYSGNMLIRLENVCSKGFLIRVHDGYLRSSVWHCIQTFENKDPWT